MQIVTQLMVESLLLSVAAAPAGLALGVSINEALLQFLSFDNSMTVTADLDGRVLAFSLVMAFVTAFVFGLAPALQATRPHLSETLKNEAGSIFGGRSHARMRKVLVVAQVSLSLLLLIVSSLFVRSLSNLHKLDPGFRKDQVISFSIDPALNGYTPQRIAQFYRDMQDRLRALPGVTGVGVAVQRLLDGRAWLNMIRTVEGYTPREDERVLTHFNVVSTGYFNTLGIPLIAGRDFEVRDVVEPQPNPPQGQAPFPARVAIVNEAFARKYFADGRAVGRRIGMGNPDALTNMEVIGIVRDTKYDQLRGDIPVQMFVPLATSPGAVVYVRTTGDPIALSSSVRSAIREIDENLPVYAMRTLEEQVDRSLVTERMIATLSSGFGSVATLLALVGLYGVMSFAVALRTREIGIRISLGARVGNILGMMMREVAVLLLLGTVIAVPAYMALGGYIRSQLYGIDPGDPLHIAGAALFLLASGLIAGYIPARRALRIDPIRVLRYE